MTRHTPCAIAHRFGPIWAVPVLLVAVFGFTRAATSAPMSFPASGIIEAPASGPKGGAELFVDGFESGTTAAWSDTIGGIEVCGNRLVGPDEDCDCGDESTPLVCPLGNECGFGETCTDVGLAEPVCLPNGCSSFNGGADCDVDCTFVECGDTLVNENAGEECDEGGQMTFSCDTDCTFAWCGDAFVNPMAGEDCDEGGVQTAWCDLDCTDALCGDGFLNPIAGEECDEGGLETAWCDLDCSTAFCGDGYPNATAGEQCDDGGICSGGSNPGQTCAVQADCLGGGVCTPVPGDGCSETCQIEMAIEGAGRLTGTGDSPATSG